MPTPKPASTPVSLPFNLDAISTDGNRTDGNFDGGYTYPAELVPSTLVRDGVTFQLGPTNNGALNALACQGQTIPLNASGYSQLYFLAASASNSTTATFVINAGSISNTVSVPYFSGFFGQWYPASLPKNQDVALVCTHRHTGAGANDAYRFCYLFKYHLDLPANATSVILPNAPNLRIFAMSLATNTGTETVPAGGPLGQIQPPWANAGPSRIANAASTNGNANVALDGTGSVAPGGTIISYAWSTNGIPFATGPSPIVSLPIGTNVLMLTVTDDQGQSAVDLATIVVIPPLSVSASATPTNGSSAPLTVQFSGEASGGGLFDTTDDHRGMVTARGENTGSGEVATNAFDNITGTKWLDFVTTDSWIQYQYPSGNAYTVTAYTITSANDAVTYPGRNPMNWRLLGSNNGGSSWATLDVQTNQTFTGNFQKLSYSFSNTVAYNSYRFQIDSVSNTAAGCLQLDELEFLAVPPPYADWWSFGDGTTSTLQNPQHIYTTNGTYTVTFVASSGIYVGTNTVQITVGAPLAVTSSGNPPIGTSPLSVQFAALASGGRTSPPLFDTTDDHLGTVTAQGENAGLNGNWEVATNAFDDAVGTKWLDMATNYPATRQSWIQYQYANGEKWAVRGYTITSANDAMTYPERNPANWRLLGSNNGGATWTSLDIQSNQVFTANFQTLTFPISNTNAYNIYRFQIDSVYNPSKATCMQIAELQFLAVAPVYSYWWSFGDGTTSTLQNPQHTYGSNGSYTAAVVASDGVSSVTNTFLVTVASPPLSIYSIGSARFGLNWPGWASNVNVYTTTNLSSPAAWSLVTNPITAYQGTNEITLPFDAPIRFFQLRSP